MNWKTVLLFWAILLAFFGCRKTEKKLSKPKVVHEISLGILFSEYSSNPKEYYFGHFAQINLLNDSIFIKYINTKSGNGDSIIAGNFPFNHDSITLRFLSEALITKNGTKFLSPFDSTNLCKPNLFPIVYTSDSVTKYFFFQEGNKAFEDFIALVGKVANQKKLRPINNKINLNDDSLAQFLMQTTDFHKLPLAIPICQKTIKFTPPVEKKPQ